MLTSVRGYETNGARFCAGLGLSPNTLDSVAQMKRQVSDFVFQRFLCGVKSPKDT
jgi:hypothetical protein